MQIEAYFEEWSRLPGETVRMAVSTPHKSVRATMERIVRGPTSVDSDNGSHPFGDPIAGIDITIPGKKQTTPLGSYGDFPLGQCFEGAWTLHLWFRATVPDWDQSQTVFSVSDASDDAASMAVEIRNGALALQIGEARYPLDLTVAGNTWYSLVVSVNGDQVRVEIRQVRGVPGAAVARTVALRAPGAGAEIEALRLAAAGVSESGSAINGFNGKIGTPSFYDRTLTPEETENLHTGDGSGLKPRLCWNLAETFNRRELREISGRAPDATLRNGAERAVTGHNWTGLCDSFLTVPEQYAAIAFHSDEMLDAGWDYNLSFDLPDDLTSGIYAVRLEAEGHVDLYPLFVRAAPGTKADVLFIVPTNTYLAYANDRFASADLSSIMGHDKCITDEEKYLNANPEFGRSCYDVHADGTPVRYSSRRRPLVTVRPHFPNWITGSYRHFAVDLFFIEWLESLSHSYHVVTDEDLHREGPDLLNDHKVIVTGSHPEYWTNDALTAVEHYLKSGGRGMYMGGNGFYWVTSIDPDRPWIVEIRRENGGVRAWDAPPGERNHVHTGEPGGLWKYRDRGPNSLFGVGFATEGFSEGKGYTRSEASYAPRFKAFFDGVDEGVIGDFGYILNGAAGDELDRFDVANGSPEHTIVLSSATGFGREYLVVPEDTRIPMPDQDGPNRPDLVRADMVYLPYADGGEIFSVGSIAFVGSMAWNGFDNNAARVATNVLNEFVAGTNAARQG
ncbi:LamG domain-containing protein [Rhodobacteraceae bacterium LMO-12]|nr:LamG domain-containing protein [Rhodobacteraceae bacterium LMO-JJ12]